MVTGGSSLMAFLRGTFVPPAVIPHVASWCSPEFAVKVSKIVNQYYIDEAVRKKDRLLQKKEDKIDRMSRKMDEQSANIDKLVKNSDKQMQKLSDMEKIAKKSDKKIKKLLSVNDEISCKLTTSSHDRVVSTGNSDDQCKFVLIKTNDKEKKKNIYSDDESDQSSDDEDPVKIYDYYVMRVLKKTYKFRIADFQKVYPKMEVIFEIKYSPNSINLWQRIKNKLGKGRKKKIEYKNCNLNIIDPNYDQDDLIKDIKEIHKERIIYE